MPNQSITLDTDALFNQIKARLEAGSHTAGTAVTPSGEDSAVALAASLCAAARDAISQNPNLQPKTAAKAISPVMVDDPAEITKSWFTSVLHAVTTFGPVFLDAMSKDFKPVPVGWNDVLAAVPQERLQDKDWLDFAAHVLSTLVPAAVDAMQGTKDFTDPASVPDIAIPPGKDKNWFTSALNFAATAAKIVVPLVLAA
jgi:hypothetical protein